MDTWSVTTEYVSNPDRVAGENTSVGSVRPIHSDLGWHRDTERGQKWALCWWHNLLAVSRREGKLVNASIVCTEDAVICYHWQVSAGSLQDQACLKLSLTNKIHYDDEFKTYNTRLSVVFTKLDFTTLWKKWQKFDGWINQFN